MKLTNIWLRLKSLFLPIQYKDAKIRKKLQALENRFQGATEFLKKTIVTKDGRPLHLNQLPWYLLIGLTEAGKTSLLANSQVNFILQRQFQNKDLTQLDTSENCDWWITRDACIVDVPGNYLFAQQSLKMPGKFPHFLILWKALLRLIKKQRGSNGIDGIIIALPLPEVMKQNDVKKYHALLRNLFQRLYELQKTFSQPVPCQLIITKCDLLPGFIEFFSETSSDEITQAWGVTLPEPTNEEKITTIFTERFNLLIKKLNQQLLWRLHQERNPLARPYIKDFPLQIELLKECILDLIKRIQTSPLTLALHSVYLTSAVQSKTESASDVLDSMENTSQHAVQIFKEPPQLSRAYFVKQFISHGLINPNRNYSPTRALAKWKQRTALAISASAIICAAIILGKDFEQGVKQAYSIQNKLSEYQLAIRQFNNPDEHLAGTLKLLDSLQLAEKNSAAKIEFSHLFSFYSNKSQQKANIVYQQALQAILIPEIKNYLEEYLRNPVNRNSEAIYAVFTAYLMLGDPAHFQIDYVVNTMQQILPSSLGESSIQHLLQHITIALQTNRNTLPLNTDSITQIRKFLINMPSLKLSYILLKNMNSNNIATDVNLNIGNGIDPVFTSQQITNRIPTMFTAKEFSTILSQQILQAAQEALLGNWVLGSIASNTNTTAIATLAEQLRITYINNYIDVWESLLANIELSNTNDLAKTDLLIINLMGNHSPLLQLLQTLFDNTYFEPITSSSIKLQNLDGLLNKNNPDDNLLNQIFSSLQLLHQYIQTVLTAENEKKAAFDLITKRVKNLGTPDAITQVLLVAAKSPEPIKNWLEKIANNTWHFLMLEAGHYLDTSWQQNVIRPYQTDIANHYPFSTNMQQEVSLQKFIDFFGNPGVVTNFYNTYLQAFVDTATADWHWKTSSEIKLPLSNDTLRQIQHALRIHHAFFPNGDNKLYLQFALQPYQFSKTIKSVKLNINDKQILDENTSIKNPHKITWPSNNKINMTSIELTMNNQKSINKIYPGTWGLFKLVNQSFESAISHKTMLINLAITDQSVKYLLSSEGTVNPFLSLNLQHFKLPQQLTEET